MLLIARLVLRRNWLAYCAWVGLGVALLAPRVHGLDLTATLILMLAGVVMLIRFGLLTLVVATLVQNAVDHVTITLEPSSWYAGGMLLVLAIVSAIAVYAFWISLGGKPLFADEALES